MKIIYCKKIISFLLSSQVTPAGYTFAIWGVIYTWQALWVAYAWSFTCRPNTSRSIFIGVYTGYAVVNALNITWIYVWGNAFVVAACVILILFNMVLYITIAMQFGYFKLAQASINKVDTVFTYALPMNGLCLYATWTTIASLINLTAAVQTTTDVNPEDMATVSLSLLLGVLLLYFVLENTVLDNFGFRYVYSVYPVVIWALTGVLVAHWGNSGERRNNIYTLILLLLTVVLFIVRMILVPLFIKFRPHKKESTVV